MAAPVYSTLFLAATGENIAASYVVPDGRLAVIRDLAILYTGSPEDTAGGVLDVTTGTWAAYHLAVDTDEFWQWQGRQVFPAGAEIQGLTRGSNVCSLRLSGYLLIAP